MDSLLLISDESALEEALTSELPDFRIRSLKPSDAVREPQHTFAAIVVDTPVADIELNAWLAAASAPVIHTLRPIRLRELLYTICARVQSKTASKEEISLTPHTTFLLATRTLRKGDQDIVLTEKETELLVCLLAAKEALASRESLLQKVWGYRESIDTHTLETHIYRLRGKLRGLGDTIDIISSEGGYGLSFTKNFES